jgi:hypothetical protein
MPILNNKENITRVGYSVPVKNVICLLDAMDLPDAPLDATQVMLEAIDTQCLALWHTFEFNPLSTINKNDLVKQARQKSQFNCHQLTAALSAGDPKATEYKGLMDLYAKIHDTFREEL